MHQRPLGAQPGAIHTTNAFAALDTSKSKKKKKSGKDDKGKKDKGKTSASTAPPLGSTTLPVISDVNFDDVNWAEEDDDDGFAMAPMADWVQTHQQMKIQAQAEAAEAAAQEQQEAEDHQPNMVDIAAQLGMEVGQEEDDTDEESESMSKPTSRNVSEIVSASQHHAEPKIEEKQLSKKELKQKEMAELAAVLGELGINAENVEAGEPSEAALKRKKKKERAKQNVQEKVPSNGAADEHQNEEPQNEEPLETVSKVLDPAEARKRLANKAAGKKKKPTSAMARVAAEEAKARAQKEAAFKDKDKKKHYNQERR